MEKLRDINRDYQFNRDYQLEPLDAIRRVNDAIRNMLHHYLALGKLYVQDGTAAYGQAAAKGAAGLVLLLIGWVLFVGATVAALSPEILPYWASLGAWTLIHIIAGAWMVRSSIKEIKGAGVQVLKPDEVPLVNLDYEIRMRGMVP
ncbi:MAG: phage holin family protein [Bdellovibrionia bacterium]